MKKLLILAVLIGSFMTAFGQTKTEADSAYVRGDYDQAISLYSDLLKEGVSSSVYYNLGNAYFRKGDMARAILSYERAYLLNPGDEDIRFNLDLARTRVVDKIVPESEMFFITWYKQLVDCNSADAWAKAALVFFVLAMIGCLSYFFGAPLWMRKGGFSLGVAGIVLAFLFHIFASQQNEKLQVRNHAIVMSSSLTVKSTPSSSGTDLFVLHEGTKVEIIDDTMEEWKEVRLADGKEGWIPVKSIERI